MAGIEVGDRVVWQDFSPSGKVVEVFAFRCRVFLPHHGDASPTLKKRVRVWLRGATPAAWPAE